METRLSNTQAADIGLLIRVTVVRLDRIEHRFCSNYSNATQVYLPLTLVTVSSEYELLQNAAKSNLEYFFRPSSAWALFKLSELGVGTWQS